MFPNKVLHLREAARAYQERVRLKKEHKSLLLTEASDISADVVATNIVVPSNHKMKVEALDTPVQTIDAVKCSSSDVGSVNQVTSEDCHDELDRLFVAGPESAKNPAVLEVKTKPADGVNYRCSSHYISSHSQPTPNLTASNNPSSSSNSFSDSEPDISDFTDMQPYCTPPLPYSDPVVHERLQHDEIMVLRSKVKNLIASIAYRNNLLKARDNEIAQLKYTINNINGKVYEQQGQMIAMHDEIGALNAVLETYKRKENLAAARNAMKKMRAQAKVESKPSGIMDIPVASGTGKVVKAKKKPTKSKGPKKPAAIPKTKIISLPKKVVSSKTVAQVRILKPVVEAEPAPKPPSAPEQQQSELTVDVPSVMNPNTYVLNMVAETTGETSSQAHSNQQLSPLVQKLKGIDPRIPIIFPMKKKVRVAEETVESEQSDSAEDHLEKARIFRNVSNGQVAKCVVWKRKRPGNVQLTEIVLD